MTAMEWGRDELVVIRAPLRMTGDHPALVFDLTKASK